ncbi:hypothetical protein DER46DRAFT_681206 [Fusarium sp. MPI-SDFR-AT-0072]|nr:hypothetical protein DER46DRAFT_681206 [Fusarium sp. MPI-SDFR-AT-0072]
MRSSVLHSVALSLAGLQAAGASVCKPKSLSSRVSTIASTTFMALETTRSGFASESSALSSTIISASAEVTIRVGTTKTEATTDRPSTSEVTTTVAAISTGGSTTEGTSTAETTIATESVSSVDVLNTTETTDTEADTPTTEASSSTAISASKDATQATSSTETTVSSDTASVSDTTTVPTSIHTTTTTEAVTTTTAELPAITDFQLKGTRAPVQGTPIYSNSAKGNYLLFASSYPGYTPATFRVEAITGRLLIDNSLPVCAFFQPDQDLAALTTCSDPLKPREVAITCTPPAKDGGVLSCSVPAQTSVETPVSFFETVYTCAPTGEILSDMSTNFNYNINQNIPVIGKNH